MYLKNFHRLSLLILLVSFTVIPDSRAFQITGAENKYLAIDDPSREEVKLQKKINLAIKQGIPIEITEIGTQKAKELASIDALLRAVNKVYQYDDFLNTQYAKNIQSSEYGLIKSIEKISELENIISPMGVPDPSMSSWTIKYKVIINTKLSPENVTKISNDQRVFYTQSIGQNVQQARLSGVLEAVKQYHRVNIYPNSVFVQNFLKSNYGVVEKIEPLKDFQLPFGNQWASNLKVTLGDISTKKNFSQIRSDLQKSLVPEPPNPMMDSINLSLDDLIAAQNRFANGLNLMAEIDLKRKDVEKMKSGTRLGESAIDQKLVFCLKSQELINESIEKSPKLSEEAKKEFEKGYAPWAKGVAGLGNSIAQGAKFFSGIGNGSRSGNIMGDLLVAMNTITKMPKVLAIFSSSTNLLTSFGKENKIDTSSVSDLGKQLGE
ncbi:hypothetical protein MCEMOHM34_00739 [Candidatus Methylopumilus universalis]|uniref:hypothetical protein n=1 Tax=Candidatus Methylopumilus universalis TaxID=2588536 RepID=UPI003BEF0E4B